MIVRNALLGQLVRYGIAGIGVAMAYSAVYETTLRVFEAGSQVANTLAFLVSVSIGYFIHSRWSFRDHGRRDAPLRNTSRFLAVNVATFVINSFWVWLIVDRLELSPHLPLAPILLLMPWFSFWLNRHWTFGER
jgi:putative flippase GtrA